jgi:hypothetical protein
MKISLPPIPLYRREGEKKPNDSGDFSGIYHGF